MRATVIERSSRAIYGPDLHPRGPACRAFLASSYGKVVFMKSGRKLHGQCTLICKAIPLVCLLTCSQFPATLSADTLAWDFSYKSFGTNISFLSPTRVDSLSPVYDFSFSLLDINVDTTGVSGTLTRSFSQASKSNQGSLNVSPGGILYSRTLTGTSSVGFVFQADFDSFVEPDGYVRLNISNITFGKYPVEINQVLYVFDVIALSGTGRLTLVGVPEPSALALLVLGGGIFIWRLKSRG